jgi:hypothetical protein
MSRFITLREHVQITRGKKIIKHQSGGHDQESHGNWADGGSGTFTGGQFGIALKNYSVKQDIDTPQVAKAFVAKRLSERIDATTEELVNAFQDDGLGVQTPFGKKLQAAVDADAIWTDNLGRPISSVDQDELGTHVALNSYGNLLFYTIGSHDVPPGDVLERPWVKRGSPEAKEYARVAAVGELVNQWATTSNDDEAISLAIQKAAEVEFNMKNVAPWQTTDDTKIRLDYQIRNNQKVHRAFLRAQYEDTQRVLADMGVKEVELYRGKIVDATNPLGTVAKQHAYGTSSTTTVQQRPLSSWTFDVGVADSFSEGAQPFSSIGVTMRTLVPARRILATSLTGVGSMVEGEVVILGGGSMKTNVRLPDDWFALYEPVAVDDNTTDYKP